MLRSPAMSMAGCLPWVEKQTKPLAGDGEPGRLAYGLLPSALLSEHKFRAARVPRGRRVCGAEMGSRWKCWDTRQLAGMSSSFCLNISTFSPRFRCPPGALHPSPLSPATWGSSSPSPTSSSNQSRACGLSVGHEAPTGPQIQFSDPRGSGRCWRMCSPPRFPRGLLMMPARG